MSQRPINPQALADPSKVQGDDDHESARHYREATEKFVEAGKVDQAPRAAKPASDKEAEALKAAEAAGKAKAKH